MQVVERARGFFDLTRAANATAAAALTFLGAFVGGGLTDHPVEVTAAVAATWLAVGAGNAINDYFDREIDAVNRPDRPIPRGAVTPRGALVFSGALFAIAVVLVLALPPLAIAIALVNLVALVAYTEVFKGTPGLGNAIVAYLVGSTFLFGGAAVEAVEPTLVLFLLAALSTLSREIIKDVEDLPGDREAGLNTLPIAVGRTRALWLAAAMLVVAVLASPLPFLEGIFGAPYLALVLPANAVMLWAAAESFGDPGAGQRRLKYGMFLAVIAFVVGRLAEVGGF